MNVSDILKKAIIINKKKSNKLHNRTTLKKIGVMGGTFNPIHYGHLATAEAVRNKYNLDKIIFMPSGNPPHKSKKEIIHKDHRYNMTMIATMSNIYFEASDIEIKRDGMTYTVDTLEQLKKNYKNSQIFFITGADALCDIDSWKYLDKNFELATFVGATRPGIECDEVNQKIDQLKQKYNANILDIYVPSLDISSTNLRKKIKKIESIKYLLPENVEKYIYKNNLYR